MGKIIGWVLVAVLIIWGGYTLISDDGTSTDEPIKIGFIGPLSGDAAVYGEPGRDVVALAVARVNAEGGVDGRMLELLVEDGQCNGKDATSAMQKLVNVDGVKFVIGGFC
jgi:branched-chain amino acid transport system substrate-binding protein|tara:strand:+ start:1104 stop:1433 length:330 start_codon:yes stop_codon:yes gene_type:complete